MKTFAYLSLLLSLLVIGPQGFAQQESSSQNNFFDDLDPRDPNIEQILKELDEDYRSETGKSPFIEDLLEVDLLESEPRETCRREVCPVWAQIIKSEQRMYLYIDGRVEQIFDVSTGVRGYGTPDMELNPNGRIYDRYTSRKFPGGDYNGLGNMPYAVFLKGGYAIHGTTKGNWEKLGTPASHGCIRLHPDHAFYFNRLVREQGIKNVWVTIQ